MQRVLHFFFLFLCLLPAMWARGQGSPGSLTFTSGGHVVQFDRQGYRVASMTHALVVGFVNSREVVPVNDSPGIPEENEVPPLQDPGVVPVPAGKGPSPLGKVRYPGVWDKVTAVYTGNQGGILESTYELEPDGDSTRVSSIVLQYNRPVKLDQRGNLVITYEQGTLTESAPVAWQDDQGKRLPVEVHYRLLPGNRVGFRLGRVIPGLPVTIDPTLGWNTFLGSSSAEVCYGIAMDDDHLYVCGYSLKTFGSPVRAYTSSSDCFVVCLNTDGSVEWNTFLGGSGSDYGYGIAVSPDGTIIVAGYCGKTWGSPVLAYTGGYDCFVARLGSTGTLLWNTFLGGTGDEGCNGVTISDNYYIYVAGYATKTWGSPVRAFEGNISGSVACVDLSGNLLWNTFLGGTSSDRCYFLVTDSDDNCYVTGTSSGASWESPIRAYTGGSDGFVAKLSVDGSLEWNTFLGGSGTDYCYGITIGSNDSLYVCGYSSKTWGSPKMAYGSGSDGFVAKLGLDGSLEWNSFIGANNDFVQKIVLDSDNNIYVTGYALNSWGDPDRAFSGIRDGFVEGISPDGSSMLWNFFLGGSGNDYCYDIVHSSVGRWYVCGYSEATWGTPLSSYLGSSDAFVAKIMPPNKWTGSVSLYWDNSSNWSAGEVPAAGADIEFSSSASNRLYTSSNRTIGALINTTTYPLVVGPCTLKILGDLELSNGAQIDGTAYGSGITFAGSDALEIPEGTFVDNYLYNLTVNSSAGVTMDSDLTLGGSLTVNSGDLDLTTNLTTLTFSGNYDTITGSVTVYNLVNNGNLSLFGALTVEGTISSTDSGRYIEALGYYPITFSGSSAQILQTNLFVSKRIYDLVVNNSNNVTVDGDLTLSGDLTATSGGLDVTTNSSTIIMTYPTLLSDAFVDNKVYNVVINLSSGVKLDGDLTLTGSLTATSGSLDVTTNSSTLTFAGSSAQMLTSSALTDNTAYSLSVNNSDNLTLDGDLTLTGNLSADSGGLDASANNTTLTFSGSSAQSIYGDNLVHNLEINNGNNVSLAGNLTLTGDLTTTSGALDASTNASTLTFSGNAMQTLSSGALTGNTAYNLAINNSNNVTLDGDLALSGDLTSTSGGLDVTTNLSTLTFSGSSLQTLSSGALTGNSAYNLAINNSNNVTLAGDLSLTGDLSATSGGLDVTTNSSSLTFSGNAAQSIGEDVLVDNAAYNLTVDNAAGVTENSDLSVSNDLDITSGSSLTVSAGKWLEVTGTLTNSAGETGLVLDSNTSSMASLLYAGTGVSGTVNRYIGPGVSWKFISTPVSGQTIFDSGNWTPAGSYGDGTGYDLYAWDEPGSCWIYNLNTGTEPTWSSVQSSAYFTPGRGYLYSLATAGTNSFAGTLTSGTVSEPVTASGSGTNDEGTSSYTGFNLVGNPYPSSIDWTADAGYSREVLTIDNGGYNAWIWSSDNNNYGVFNSASTSDEGTNGVIRYIAPTEGFFVQAATAGTLVFNNDARVNANGGAWVKSAVTGRSRNQARLKVKSLSGSGGDEAWFDLGNGTNSAGAGKLFSVVKTAPSLYLRWKGDTLTTLHLTDTVENKTINLDFKSGQAGSYTLTCNPVRGGLTSLYLKDRITGAEHDFMQDTTYTFSSETSDAASRFVLYFNVSTNVDESGDALVYLNGDDLEVNLEGLDSANSYEVSVHDIKGRMLGKKTLSGGSTGSYALSTRGVYLVKVKGNGMNKGYKVVH